MKTTKKKPQRQLLWILPLLVLPFITALFWSMGGGKESLQVKASEKKGLNSKLPETTLSEESYSKLNYYDQAEQDSTKQEDLRKKDPFFAAGEDENALEKASYVQGTNPLLKSSFRSSSEQQVMERLKALQRAVEQPTPKKEYGPAVHSLQPSGSSDPQVRKLEAMMAQMETSPAEEDKEMQQINGMLENILDIQHPERVQERLKKQQRANKGNPLTIAAPQPSTAVGSLSPGPKHFGPLASANDFYSLENSLVMASAENVIPATIAESQTCVNGSTVKLRLSQEIVLGETRIPQNTFVYGVASLKGERLNIEVNSIRYQNSLYPVELMLYDMDGLEGIFIPGAITRDVAKASADRSMQGIGITTLEDSWGAQAAGAGIEAAKSLLSKKVKLVKVAVKAGYQVLLKAKKENNH